MYNLLIAIGIAVVGFIVGAQVAGTWQAGVPVALLAGGVGYVLLARRTGRKLEAIFAQATKEFQQGRIENGRRILREALPLQKWQFLVEAQVNAQLGAVDYMQRRWKDARRHLEGSWSRIWMAQAMLACLDYREGHPDAALDRLEKVAGPGGKDPVFWGLYAWIALQSGDRDKALSIIDRGLQKNGDSGALKSMAAAVRNKKKLKMKAFAPAWYQFFPEHIPQSELRRMAGGSPPRR